MAFDVWIEGLDEAKRDWATAMRELGSDLRKAVSTACGVGKQQLKADAPERSGELRRSVTAGLTSSSALGAEGEIVVNADHGVYVLEGTEPHEIRAKNAKALRFETQDGVVFAKSVQHPGTKPNDFVSHTEEVVDAELAKRADEALDKFTAKVV